MNTERKEKLKSRVEGLKGENKTLKEKLASLEKANRLVEKALRESWQLFDHTPVALILIQEGKIILANETARERFGFSEEEIIGRSFLDLVHPDSYAYVRGIHRKMISGKMVQDRYEIHMNTKDGTPLCCEIRIKKARFKGRRAFLLNIIGLDHRKQKELRRSRAQKTEALACMASGLRHALTDDLNILDKEGMRPQNEGVSIDSQQLNYLRKCKCTREQRDSIIQALNILARVEYDESDIVFFNLKKIVRNAVLSTRHMWKGSPEHPGAEINLKTYLRNLAPVQGRPKEIQSAFQNMIANAIDALPDGGEIYLSTEEGSGFACVYIQDNGVGISDDIREKIFDPFFTTNSSSRLGLGLSTAYAIIDQHGGEIEVMSTVGQGTTFIIRLPLAQKPPLSRAKAAKKKIKNADVLVISNGGIFEDLLCQLIISKGGKITSASNGSEGLKLLKKNKFDLIIIDLNISYLVSSKIIPRLKKIEPGLPIALVTDQYKGQSVNAFKKLGADLTIGSPFEMDRTMSLISQTLAKGSSSV